MRLIDADTLLQTFCAECNHTIKCEDCDIKYHIEHEPSYIYTSTDSTVGDIKTIEMAEHDIEWHKAHKAMGFWDPIADLFEELDALAREDDDEIDRR